MLISSLLRPTCFPDGGLLHAATPSPSDWRDQSIYQIMTDRFFDGDGSNNGVEGNFDPTDGAKSHGGDWAGIEQKLDYIQALGATAIWISPVQKNAFGAYHGYHIQDFYSFAQQFGGYPALGALIDEAHGRGLFVILDVIANHGGDLIDSNDPNYPDFHDPGDYSLRWKNQSNKAAPPFDDLSWYHNNGGIDAFIDPNQILGELFGLDDFRTEETTVRDALIAAHRWLIDTTDADGFRVDTVKHVEIEFWQEFGPELHSFAGDTLGKQNFFMYGEIFDGSSSKNGMYTGTQAGGAFALDATLWFPMHFTARSVFRDGDPTEWLSNVYADSIYYDPAARSRLVNFLDNHDVGRFMGFQSGADRDEAKSKVALAWLHTSLGIPCVYYGTEQEFDGGGDPWNREDMWEGSWDFGPSEGDNFLLAAPLFNWVRNLNALRRLLPALRRGSQDEVIDSPGAGLFAYYRRLVGEETVLVILNTKESADTLIIDPDLPGGVIYEGLTGRSFSIPSTGDVDFIMGGLSAAVYSAAPLSPAPWVARTWPPHDGSLAHLDGNLQITFTGAMNEASTESSLSITPAIPYDTQWVGATLIIKPSVSLSDQTQYTLEIGEAARSASGDSLGTPFTFFFTTDSGASSISVPSGYYSSELPGDDIRTALSLETGRAGTPTAGRLLLGDTGWDRILFHEDNGFVDKLFQDDLLVHPRSISLDRSGGLFDGDLLVADVTDILRARLGADDLGLVTSLAPLPTTGIDWIIAVDSTAGFGGRAYFGGPGHDTVYSVDSSGTIAPFTGGLGGVNGLAFSLGGAFGNYLYVSGDDGTIRRIDSLGGATLFLSDPGLLSGASALAFDPVGAMGGSLLVASNASQSILRVSAEGSTSTFATGFSQLAGGDCLVFDHLGNLYAAEQTRLVKILPLSLQTNVEEEDEAPPLPYPFLLQPNRPNPFNPRTEIRYMIPGAPGTTSPAALRIFDTAGRRVATLVDGTLPTGGGRTTWDGTDARGKEVAAGIYFVRLEAGRRSTSRKITLLR